MPRTITVSTYLPYSPEKIWDHVQTVPLLEYVCKGMIKFKSLEPDGFPTVWPEGEHRVAMLWKGFLPVGTQVIGIEYPPAEGNKRLLRDNGYGPLIKTWDHLISVEPEGEGTRYTDKLVLDAGWLTPAIALFANRFYRHRQKRWRRLIEHKFDYST